MHHALHGLNASDPPRFLPFPPPSFHCCCNRLTSDESFACFQRHSFLLMSGSVTETGERCEGCCHWRRHWDSIRASLDLLGHSSGLRTVPVIGLCLCFLSLCLSLSAFVCLCLSVSICLCLFVCLFVCLWTSVINWADDGRSYFDLV